MQVAQIYELEKIEFEQSDGNSVVNFIKKIPTGDVQEEIEYSHRYFSISRIF